MPGCSLYGTMFGTFQAEQDDQQIRYGIVRQLGSFNLLWVAFHEWIAIARDVWSAPWGSKLGYLWRPPGWMHWQPRHLDALRTRWQALQPAPPAE